MKNSIFKSLILLQTLVFMGSCAYYNTFYNTRKYYKEALQEHKKRKGDKPSSVEKQKFDKTIKQASKVLQLYPDSKYIDDSLMILGESFFYVQDYLKAERKFNELLQLFPRSQYVEAAKLWLGKTQIRLKKYTEAELGLRELSQKAKNKSIRQEAQYWLGEIFWLQKKYKEAAQEFSKAARKLKNDNLKFTAFMRLGESYRFLGDVAAEAESYRLASKQAKEPEMHFQAELEYGRALASLGKYQDAIRIFSNMIEEYFQKHEVGLAKLELANVLMKTGQTDKALEWYHAITEDHRRTTAAAGAYLALGKYEENVNHDYKAAQANYQKVRQQDSKSDYAKEANEKVANIQQLLRLQGEITKLSQQLETLKSGKAPPQAAANEPAPQKPVAKPVPGSKKTAQTAAPKTPARPVHPDSLKIQIARKRIQLAELFLFRFDKPDSAMNEYLDILSLTRDKDLRALAFYSLAYIFDERLPKSTLRDSLLQVVAKKYPDTPQGRQAAIRLGLPVKKPALPPEERVFSQAEEKLLKEQDPRSALKNLEWIVEHSEYPKWKARALFTLGWAYEKSLKNNEKAYEAYKALIDQFPKSDYAYKVRKKVFNYEKAHEKPAAPADSSTKVVGTRVAQKPPMEKTGKLLQSKKPPGKEFVEEEVEGKGKPGKAAAGPRKTLMEEERLEIERLKKKYSKTKVPPPGRPGNKTRSKTQPRAKADSSKKESEQNK